MQLSIRISERAVTSRSPSAAMARQIRAMRQARSAFIEPDLIGEPSWDLLIDLFIAAEEGRTLSANALCAASDAPATTTLRWLKLLIDRGHVERAYDRVGDHLTLTTVTRDRMEAYLVKAARAARPVA